MEHSNDFINRTKLKLLKQHLTFSDFISNYIKIIFLSKVMLIYCKWFPKLVTNGMKGLKCAIKNILSKIVFTKAA